MSQATYHGSLAMLQQRLALLPAILSGSVPGFVQASTALSKSIGIEALSCAKAAFIELGRGGTVNGIRWNPLSPAYIAYHRRHKGLNQKRSRAAKAGRASRPLLTAQHDRLWRQVYARCLDRGDDRATAAAKAWATVKRAGGRTIIGQYGNATVEIGRDTGRLLASLSPGTAENILEAQPGSVRVGSNVRYAKWFFAKRPLLPDGGELPAEWQKRIMAVVEAALPGIIERLLQR